MSWLIFVSEIAMRSSEVGVLSRIVWGLWWYEEHLIVGNYMFKKLKELLTCLNVVLVDI